MSRSARLMTTKQKQALAKLTAFIESQRYVPGDQIASYSVLARQTGISISVLSKVLGLLIDNGFLEAVPNVGTFLRRPLASTPQAPAMAPATPIRSGAAVVNFHVSEFDFVTGEIWRRVVREFESHNPDIRVHLQQSTLADLPFISTPDLVYDNYYHLLSSPKFMDWIDEATIGARDSFFEPYGRLWEQSAQRRLFPVTFSFPGLMVNRHRLEQFGLYRPDSWSGLLDLFSVCNEFYRRSGISEREVWGCCLPFSFEAGGIPIAAPGAGKQEQESVWKRFRGFLEHVAHTPVPRLVMYEDICHEHQMVEFLKHVEVLFCFSNYWYYNVLDHDRYELAPMRPAADTPAWLQTMGIAVRGDSNVADAAQRLARFIAGEQGQRILGGMRGLLPVRKNCVPAGNIMADHFRCATAKGWWIEALTWPADDYFNPNYKRVSDELISELRFGRSSVDETLLQFKEFVKTVPFSVAQSQKGRAR